MARLSQRAMNNVVIVAMLIMIALFNIDSFLPKKKASEFRSLLPQNAYMLKIEHDGNQLIRQGQQWLQRTVEHTPSISPEVQLLGWQNGILQRAPSVANEVAGEEPLVVVVWLAGEENGRVYGFYPRSSSTLVEVDNAWYTLQDVSLDTLLPWKK